MVQEWNKLSQDVVDAISSRTDWTSSGEDMGIKSFDEPAHHPTSTSKYKYENKINISGTLVRTTISDAKFGT